MTNTILKCSHIGCENEATRLILVFQYFDNDGTVEKELIETPACQACLDAYDGPHCASIPKVLDEKELAALEKYRRCL